MTTQSQKEHRLTVVAEMMEAGMAERAIVKEIMASFHVTSRQTVYNYIREAEAMVRASDDGPADSGQPMSSEDELAWLGYLRQNAIAARDFKEALKIEQLATSIARRTGAGRQPIDR